MEHKLLIPNSALFTISHVTLPFLIAWIAYLIFSLCTTGSKSKRFVYFRYEENWNCLWADTRATTLARGEEKNSGVKINLLGPQQFCRTCFQNIRLRQILQPMEMKMKLVGKVKEK